MSTSSTFQKILKSNDQLALYDQYSSLAYGVILQIIPEPELAQTVLLDLFTSPPLRFCLEVPAAGEIIRLSRTKALAARSISGYSAAIADSFSDIDNTRNMAKTVFNLSFCQGHSHEAIAKQLQISITDVLKAFCTYFKHLHSS